MSLRRPVLVLAAAVLALTSLSGVSGATTAVQAAPAGKAAPVTGTTTKTVRYGPFDLKGNPTGQHPERDMLERVLSNRPVLDMEKPCDDCFITGIRPGLVYEDGTNANVDTGPMLHHMVIGKFLTLDTTCPLALQTWAGQRIFAAGNERTGRSLPAGYGYRVRQGDIWNMFADVMTFSKEDQSVYISVEYDIAPADSGLKEATPFWMDAAGCLYPSYDVPAGEGEHVKTWDWTSTMSGKLMGLIGHVHHGGRSVQLANLDTGQVYCVSRPGAGEAPEYIDLNGEKQISSMSACENDPAGSVKKGDRLRITSTYDLADHAHGGVMGIMIGWLAAE